MSRDYRKLRAFELGHRLTIETYRLSAQLPPPERYGLGVQMRRAAVSVPANIVEGSARRSGREYVKFINIALGSACELRYLIELTRELGYLDEPAVRPSLTCANMLVASLQKLEVALAAAVGARRATTREPVPR